MSHSRPCPARSPLCALAILGAFALHAAAEGGSAASSPPPPASDPAAAQPTPQQILDAHILATGGRAAWGLIENRLSIGRIEIGAGQINGTFTSHQAAPNLMRTVIELPGYGTLDQGCDGAAAWEITPTGARRLAGRERDERLLRAELRFEAALDELFPEIACIGAAEVDGRRCWELRLSGPEHPVLRRFYDAETGLLVREIANVHRQGGPVEVQTEFDDYRKADGLRLPHRIVQRVLGQTFTMTFGRIEHDVELPEGLFEMPEVIRTTAELAPPQPEQLQWLREHAITFETVEAGHGFDDLQPLKAIIGDARIVALGEPTHGSREVFQMKHRLTEFLVSEMGFSIFAIEANMPEAAAVSDFVVHGEGDPAELIGGMYFWTWNTEEVLEMVRCMRRRNEAHGGDEPAITFTGFDMQFHQVAAKIVRDFAVEADPDVLPLIDRYERSLAGAAPAAVNFASCTATFPAEAAAGHRVRYSGWIRTEDVDGFAGLWWRADAGQQAVAFDNMQDRAPRGDTEWTRYEIELEIPAQTDNINFGVLLGGGGTAWFDGLSIEIDGEPAPAARDFDLGFEQPGHRGFFQANPLYRTSLDRGAAHEGEACLRLERIAEPDPQQPQRNADANDAATRLLQHLEANRDRYAPAHEPAEIEWAIQNARILQQYAGMIIGTLAGGRDGAMAENVRWLLEQNPDARIVLWAHNGHVSTSPMAMGSFLEQWYGDDYVPVGFSTVQGSYTAIGDAGLGEHELQAPPPASIETFFQQAGLPRAIVDLRSAADDPSGAWLAEPRPFRAIGARAMDEQFSHQRVADLYEVLVHIGMTEAARQIR